MNVNDVSFTRPLKPGERSRLGDPHRRRARVTAARADLLRSYREALGSGRFAHVIHDRDLVARWLPRGAAVTALPAGAYTAQLPGLWGAYRLEGDLAWDGAVAPTLAGNPSAARWRWRRIAEPRRPAGARVVFDLEGRDHAGWEVEGEAWGRGPVDGVLWDPVRRRPQGLVSGAAGRRWASSFHGGDAAVGRLRSPPFVIDRPTLTLRVGGGRAAEPLEVRLVVDGQVTHRATGTNREVLAEVRWDVRGLLGRTARLEAVDAATGPWGHLMFDEVLLVP
jgi:hypothetical protein